MKTNRTSSLLHRRKLLLALLSLIAAVTVTTSIAQQRSKHKVAGKITLTSTKQEAVEVGDTEGHILSLNVMEGTGQSTGPEPFMDGDKVLDMSFFDSFKGTGATQGYTRSSTDRETVFTKNTGKSTATSTAGNPPQVTTEGKFLFISGTGQFQGIQGGGTYKGKFIDEKIAVVEWEGEYTIKK